MDIGINNIKGGINTFQPLVNYADFLENETWPKYLERMSKSGQWGDHIMLQAAANVYKVDIAVIKSDGQVITVKSHTASGSRRQHKLNLGLLHDRHYVSLIG